MNINERLRKVDKNTAGFGASVAMHKEDYKWMHDIIKQQQEENEKNKLSVDVVAENLILQQRIAELEKERREITAAHEAFLQGLDWQIYYFRGTKRSIAFSEVKKDYNKHFQFIHLAEQVRLAKLSAGVDGE